LASTTGKWKHNADADSTWVPKSRLLGWLTPYLRQLALEELILLRARIIDVRRNHHELMTISKRTRDSPMRFYGTKMNQQRTKTTGTERRDLLFSTSRGGPGRMLVTHSKQRIHFLRSEHCPPTSNICILHHGVKRSEPHIASATKKVSE